MRLTSCSAAHSDSDIPRPLPQDWNSTTSAASLAFRYSHPQSAMQYLLKVSRLGAKTVVYGIGIGDDKTTSFDITTKDFTSESALPASPTSSVASSEDAAHAVQAIYVSPSRLTDLGSSLKLNIIQKLTPSLQKEGYEETATASSTANPPQATRPSDEAYRPPDQDPLGADPLLPNPARPHPLVDPSVAPRRPPGPSGDFPPPGFDDEYDILRPPGRGMPGNGGGPYPNLGERDLYPPGMGPNDPLRIGGQRGPGLRGPGGGGMHPTFDDPMFGGDSGGAGGFNPQVPPGARYDPTGPGLHPPRGAGGYGSMGGAPHNPFGGFGGGDFI